MSSTSFRELGFSKWLVEKLNCLGINKPSDIQARTAKIILDRDAKRDVFACSRTGSGKTLAYILPILEVLVRDVRPYFALILAPTRELALQIYEVINLITGKSSSRSGNTLLVKSILVIGGGKYGTGDENGETESLWFGKPNIVVATPGRLLDLFTNSNHLDLCGMRKTLNFEMLILDEADQLITAGFCEQMKNILSFIDSLSTLKSSKTHRQTLVFSATLTPALEHLKTIISSKNPDRQPVVINLLPSMTKIKQELATNPDLDQRYILCPEYVKMAYLTEALLDLEFKQLIIFCETKKEARLIHKVLMTLGFDGRSYNFNPVLLNSDLKQYLRFGAIEKFKSLKSRILVTTDLASRGLDLPQVDLVINYNCPKSATNYVHRVGRTCRKPDLVDDNEEKTESKDDEENDKDDDEENNENEDEENNEDKDEENKEDEDEENKEDEDEENDDDNSRYNKEEIKNEEKIDKKKKDVKLSSAAKKYKGKSLTFVTQYDIKLLQSIEQFIGIKLNKEEKIDEDNITNILKQVAVAIKDAEIRIDQEDYLNDDKLIKHKSDNHRKSKKQKT